MLLYAVCTDCLNECIGYFVEIWQRHRSFRSYEYLSLKQAKNIAANRLPFKLHSKYSLIFIVYRLNVYNYQQAQSSLMILCLTLTYVCSFSTDLSYICHRCVIFHWSANSSKWWQMCISIKNLKVMKICANETNLR